MKQAFLALLLSLPSLSWGMGDIAYVLIGADGSGHVRFITRKSCPNILFDGKPEKMAVRSKPGNARGSKFQVLTCETKVPKGVKSIIAGKVWLPVPVPEPRRIVLIGDTGCRMKGNSFQACNDPEKWPFRQVSLAAAAFKPDLVIHVGDYHYRESPCPKGMKGCSKSPYGYGFDAWNADFFAPAAKLLKAAPWIFVRGNHESCFRAGQGWFRYLAPAPFSPARSCDDPANDASADYSAPYSVPISPDTQLIVFDSSKSSDASDKHYQAEFDTAGKLAKALPHGFFLSHHPVLGFAAGLHPASLQSSMHESFPPEIEAAFHGHVHLFESLDFESGYPATFVAGNSGTSTDQALPEKLPAGAEPAPGAKVGAFFSSEKIGFMTLEKVGGVWIFTERDRLGKPEWACTLRGRQCEWIGLK